jgi:hypothetical protein
VEAKTRTYMAYLRKKSSILLEEELEEEHF